jgi:hypothetical protein
VRGQYSATAANALDHAVERRVLAIDWIVRIRQGFLRGHLIGARLAVPDRCAIQHQLVVRVRRWRCGWIWRTSCLRNRHRSADQGQQRYRRDQPSHDGPPDLGPPHDNNDNGKLDHKVRQASRFVQMLKRLSAWRLGCLNSSHRIDSVHETVERQTFPPAGGCTHLAMWAVARLDDVLIGALDISTPSS